MGKLTNIYENHDVSIKIFGAGSFIKKYYNTKNNSERIVLEEPYLITNEIINFLKAIEINDNTESKNNHPPMGLIIILSDLDKQPKELQNQIANKFINMMNRYTSLINKFPKSARISFGYYCPLTSLETLDSRVLESKLIQDFNNEYDDGQALMQKIFRDLIGKWGKDYFSKTRDGNGDIIKASHEDVNYSKNLIRKNSPDFHESKDECQIF